MGTATAPARLGRYELLARLATGGMGEIFLARLEGAAGFEKLVVVKRILPHLADDARFRQMLIAEARIASKMAHANICQVHELGETDGQLYIVMEYLEGVSLLPLLRKQSKEAVSLDYGLVGGIVQQTSDALHYAHELKDRGGEYLGIVHRDVTPSNIFLTESGVAKVLDFGIAKVKDASAHTQTGTVKGKYAYMAPEQLRGGSVDRRADTFALGIVLYEMLALRRLFQRKTDYLTFRAVMEQPIPDVRQYRPDVPAPLAEMLAKALDRDPTQRFQTARQLGTAALDVLSTLKRPWSQGEISDFVRATFSAELGKRHQQVASAVHRTNPANPANPAAPVVGRTTMPLIAHDEEPPEPPPDEDEEFPAVDSAVTEIGSPARAGLPVNPTQVLGANPPTGEFQGSTPPPFANETSASGISIQALPGQLDASGRVVVMAKRSIVWPLLAIAMVGIAGAALYLVWKQMKDQQQQPQQPIVIQSQPAVDASESAPDPGSGSAGVVVDDGSGSGKKVRPNPPPSKEPSPADYRAAVSSRKNEVVSCAQTHGMPPKGTEVTITVTPKGKAKLVELSPGNLNTTPFGTCVKNVLTDVAYPAPSTEQKVSVKLGS